MPSAESTFFPPIVSEPLAESVASRLREAIICARLVPGERLSEPTLAAKMQVSRGPIREALAQLEREGLVVGQIHRSSYVWSPTESDVDEVVSLRTIVESLAAQWAIDKLTDDDFRNLSANLDRLHEAAQTGDYWQLLEVDAEFHEYICRRAGHTRLFAWWEQIMRQWEVLAYRHFRHDPTAFISLVIHDHRSILDAFRDRNLPQILELHRTINARFATTVKQTLRSRGHQVAAGGNGSASENGYPV